MQALVSAIAEEVIFIHDYIQIIFVDGENRRMPLSVFCEWNESNTGFPRLTGKKVAKVDENDVNFLGIEFQDKSTFILNLQEVEGPEAFLFGLADSKEEIVGEAQ